MTVLSRRSRVTTRPAVARVRRTPVAAESKRDFYGEVCEKLKLIANDDAEIADIMTRRQSAEREIEALMREGKLKHVDDNLYEAVLAATVGKASRNLDPAKIKKLMAPEDFMKVITVSATELKKFMTEQEINKVAPLIPGKVGEEKLTVGPKAKKRKG